MPIPESQLSRWSDHGPQGPSKRTHEAIQAALGRHKWPPGMNYDFYLQGSYRNDTNIMGDSDVDVVLELTSSFKHEEISLSQYERDLLTESFQPATYSWDDFRRETLKALENGFGRKFVAQGNKSIRLKKDPPRLAADVVACMQHRKYVSRSSYVAGITFYALRDKRWIVNYPNEHYKNGADKSRRTWDRYKRTVRMFKNARNHMEAAGRISSDLAPSYFVECLLYNAPDSTFSYGFQDTYISVVTWMIQTKLDELLCQNGQQLLFGPTPEQWSVTDAKAFANHLAKLWNEWG